MSRILVVEDDPQVLRVVTSILIGAGYDVCAARGKQEALALTESWDLMVLDLLLGDGNGRDVAAARPGVPVLTMSGDYMAEPDLRKPFGVRELLDAVAARLPVPGSTE